MHHALRLPLRHGGVESGDHELGLQMRRHRPAHDLAAPDVDDDSEVQEADPGRDVRDVRDPELVRTAGGEVALDEVRRWSRGAVAHGGDAENLRRLTPAMPASRMSRAMCFRLTILPSTSASSAWILGAP